MSQLPVTLNLSDVLNGNFGFDGEDPGHFLAQSSSGQVPSHNHAFSAEALERELASLLSEDTPPEYLSAAAQQRQAQLEAQNASPQHSGSEQLGSLTGLASVLLAANMRAAEAKGTQQVQAQTRTAPSFHTLTEEHSYPAIAPDSYFYSDDDPNHPPGPNPDAFGFDGAFGPSSAEAPSPADLADFEAILTQFAAQQANTLPLQSQPLLLPNVHAELSSANSHFPEGFMDEFADDDDTAVASTSTGPGTAAAAAADKPKNKGGRKPNADRGPFICEEEDCHRSFTRKSDVQRHMRIHTGERPFPCPYPNCAKAFIQNSALIVHMRVHSGEKPHNCEYPGCDKTFGDSSSLARHRRTHTGKRPYKCEDQNCNKNFTRRETLINHMKMHDPGWTPAAVPYNYIPQKRRKVGQENDDAELDESVRTISAMFCAPGGENAPEGGDLQLRVAAVSAEISAAIAQAQARGFDGVYQYAKQRNVGSEEEQEQEEEESEPDTPGPNTHPVPIPAQHPIPIAIQAPPAGRRKAKPKAQPKAAPKPKVKALPQVVQDIGSDSDDEAFVGLALRPRQTTAGKKRKRT